MSDLNELETRIASALVRLQQGIEGLPDGGLDQSGRADAEALEAEVARLTSQLDEERTANAHLEERVKVLKQRQDGELAELESSVEANRGRAARMDRELQRLRHVNAELRDINNQLREAVTAQTSEPHLVNKAMLAELEALRATRAADAAEMDAILEELTPIIEREAADATG